LAQSSLTLEEKKKKDEEEENKRFFPMVFHLSVSPFSATTTKNEIK